MKIVSLKLVKKSLEYRVRCLPVPPAFQYTLDVHDLSFDTIQMGSACDDQL